MRTVKAKESFGYGTAQAFADGEEQSGARGRRASIGDLMGESGLARGLFAILEHEKLSTVNW